MIYTFKESALILKASKAMRISKRTVYRKLKSGKVTMVQIKKELSEIENVYLFTATEVAAILNCSVSTIHRLSKNGMLLCKKLLGTAIRFKEGDIQEAINSGKVRSANEKR